jgi:hypothetical protein
MSNITLVQFLAFMAEMLQFRRSFIMSGDLARFGVSFPASALVFDLTIARDPLQAAQLSSNALLPLFRSPS